MKKHNPRMNKKGAMELSMTTIVVVIIGVTLLTLGIRWVYSIFEDLDTQQNQMNSAMQEKIREMFGESDDPLNILTKSVDIEQGENYDLGVGVKNTLSEKHEFVYEIEITSTAGGTSLDEVSKWIGSGEGVNIPLDSGEMKEDLITIDVPKSGSAIGTYRLEIKLNCVDCDIQSSLPFVFRVQ